MRFVYTIGLFALGLALCGCSSTPKNSPRAQPTSSPTTNINNNSQPFWAQPDNRRGATLNVPNGPAAGDGMKLTSAEQPDVNGVLAGRLVDSMGRKPARAYIQVQPADGGTGGRPIEVAADENGYFLIPGLTPGRGYMLTARAQDGQFLLAGRVQAIPPNPRLLIKLSEAQAGGDIPPLPLSPGALPANNRGGQASISNPAPPPLPPMPGLDRNHSDGDWVPGGSGVSATPFPASTGTAEAPGPPLPPPPTAPVLNPENIAGRDRGPEVNPAPRISLPGPNTGPALPEPDPVPMKPGAGSSLRLPGPSSIPSCEIAGNRVVNLALYDLDGLPWEFRQRHGRLVLLDFWGTWCPHCIKAMPQLRELQRRYGAQGLQVIGIACEDGGGPEVVREVREVYTSKNLNYQVLLAENFKTSPVVAKFRVQRYPTLILLDENGVILARGEGSQLQQIEAIIQQRLARR